MQHIITPRRTLSLRVALYALLAVATVSLFVAYGASVKADVAPLIALNIADSGNTIVTAASVGSLLHASTTVSAGTSTVPT